MYEFNHQGRPGQVRRSMPGRNKAWNDVKDQSTEKDLKLIDDLFGCAYLPEDASAEQIKEIALAMVDEEFSYWVSPFEPDPHRSGIENAFGWARA